MPETETSVPNPANNAPTAAQMLALHRSSQLFKILGDVRRTKVEMFLVDMDGAIDPNIAAALLKEFESLAALCLAHVEKTPLSAEPQPEVLPS